MLSLQGVLRPLSMSLTDFIALHLAFLCVRKKVKKGERAQESKERERECVCVCVCVYVRATELGSFRP